MNRDEPRDAEDDQAGAAAELDAVVARAFAKRGELPPVTSEEVLAAMEEGVEFEGELPASLKKLPEDRPSQRALAGAGAASQRVVSLEDLRRRREKMKAVPWVSHAVTFGMGVAAAAAAAMLWTPRPGPPDPLHDPAAGAPSASASSLVDAPPAPVAIAAVTTCPGDCCAGSSCAAAKGELRKCLGGKVCIGCDEQAPRGSAYRVRIGNLLPAKKTDPEALRTVDLCARVGSSAWSCEPAVVDAATRPEGRTLPAVASAADLTASIELELRLRGSTKVLGAWRDAVRIGPTVLCHGLGALLATEKKEDLGSVAISLEDTHFVELARGADVLALKEARRGFAFSDVVPSLVETSLEGAERFALTVGPLDKATADRLRWALLEQKREAQVGLGADYVGSAQSLP